MIKIKNLRTLRQLGLPKKVKNSYGDNHFIMLVTDNNVYYGNPDEGDDNGNTMIFTRDMKLLSDNYFASSSLYEDVLEIKQGRKRVIWISRTLKANLDYFE